MDITEQSFVLLVFIFLSAFFSASETAFMSLSDIRIQHLLEQKKRGIKVLICGAGGAAALAGVVASHTDLPVIGVPIETKALKGLDSLLSTVQMPSGVPVASMAIGKSGAKNAAIFAAKILSI